MKRCAVKLQFAPEYAAGRCVPMQQTEAFLASAATTAGCGRQT
jgi:hypothetical protein